MKKSPKIAEKFCCIKCDYICCKLSDYNKHLTTRKHENRTKLNVLEQKVAENRQDFVCTKCSKTYKARNSLWYHEKSCVQKTIHDIDDSVNHNDNKKNEYTNNNSVTTDMIIELIKQNTELKNIILEQNSTINNLVKNGTINNSNNVISNNGNKTFNLQLFLNETCKDAMNIKDFINSMVIPFDDFTKVGDLGYVEGISNIIVKSLNNLDITKRPIHCTDKKREVLYVKDDGVWEKEDVNNSKLRLMIKHVAHKNARQLLTFKEKHPDCNRSNSKFSDQYNKLTIETMGGLGDNDTEKEDKIIKNISKIVTIDKLC